MVDKLLITNRRRIVLTGAWGGGKTALLDDLLTDTHYKGRLITLPEAAPLTRSMGFDKASDGFEKLVLAVQHSLEDACDCPEHAGDRRSIILHRGSLDTLAFWRYEGRGLLDYLALTGTSLEAELSRYDMVILMQSTARQAPEVYQRYQEAKDRPSARESITLENYLEEAWRQHPRFFSIPNNGLSWKAKSALAKALLDARIHTTTRTRKEVNARLQDIDYPSSHQYQITERGQIQPRPKTQERLDELSRVLPRHNWDSLIDVGCGKGLFLFWAMQQYGVKRGIGIDAAKDMVDAGREAADVLNAPVTILHGTLNSLYPAIPSAELVFVFHCYHYLYFGSPSGTPALPSHAYWFDLFNRITTDTLVFANTLTLSQDKVMGYREKGFSSRDIGAYSEEAIMNCARKYFDIQKFSLGGGRPYIAMRKRTQK